IASRIATTIITVFFMDLPLLLLIDLFPYLKIHYIHPHIITLVKTESQVDKRKRRTWRGVAGRAGLQHNHNPNPVHHREWGIGYKGDYY
ncbi:MAG: hypothetical protein II019_02695, partial [Bacteroidales bacterium]|nr:hypothetical protein [Bacteroidales bacterium]